MGIEGPNGKGPGDASPSVYADDDRARDLPESTDANASDASVDSYARAEPTDAHLIASSSSDGNNPLIAREAVPQKWTRDETEAKIVAEMNALGYTRAGEIGRSAYRELEVRFKADREGKKKVTGIVLQACVRVAYREVHGQAAGAKAGVVVDVAKRLLVFLTKHRSHLDIPDDRFPVKRGRKKGSKGVDGSASTTARTLFGAVIDSSVVAQKAVDAHDERIAIEAEAVVLEGSVAERVSYYLAQVAILEGRLRLFDDESDSLSVEQVVEILEARESRDLARAWTNVRETSRLLAQARVRIDAFSAGVTETAVQGVVDRLQPEIDAWLSNPERREHRSPLLEVVTLYVRLWLTEQGGNVPERLGASPEVLSRAAELTAQGFGNASQRKTFIPLAEQFIDHLVRSSREGQMASAAGTLFDQHATASVDANVSRRERVGPATPAARLHALLGGDLHGRYQFFFDGLRQGVHSLLQGDPAIDRDMTAAGVSMLLSGYVKALAKARPDEPVAEQIKTYGVEIDRLQEVIDRHRTFYSYSKLQIDLFSAFIEQGRGAKQETTIEVKPATNVDEPRGDSVDFVPIARPGVEGILEGLESIGADVGPEVRARLYASAPKWGQLSPPSRVTAQNWQTIVEVAIPNVWEDLVTIAREEGTLADLLIAFPPSGSLNRHWAERVSEARRKGGLDALSKKAYTKNPFPEGHLAAILKRYRPEGITEAGWARAIAEAAGEQGGLERLALRHPPIDEPLDENDARLFVAICIARGQEELVIFEPSREKAYAAIVPTFRELDRIARAHGHRLDPVEFIMAFCPALRRLANEADGNELTLLAPPYMEGVSFGVWGYPTFAAIFSGLAKSGRIQSEVNYGTRRNHVVGKSFHPTYPILQQYSRSIADAVGGDLDKKRAYYHFAASFLRWDFVFDALVPDLVDEAGGRISLADTRIPSRWRVRMEVDSDSITGSVEPRISGARSRLLFAVKSGTYTRMLALLSGHLQNLDAFPVSIELTDLQGRAVDLHQLRARVEGMMQGDAWYRDDLSGEKFFSTSSRRPADLSQMQAFYKGVRAFAEEVLFFTHARGSWPLRDGGVAFEIAPRLAGRNLETAIAGRVSLVIDDIFEEARRESWDDLRFNAAIAARATLQRLRLEGTIDADAAIDSDEVREAARARWAMSEAYLDQALIDLAMLAEHLPQVRVTDTAGRVFSRAHRERSAGFAEPALPLRRSLPPWRERFADTAAVYELQVDEQEAAVEAMAEYIETFRGLYARYWGEGLREMVWRRLPETDGDRIDRVLEAIVDFFAAIGIASDASRSRPSKRSDNDRLTSEALAQEVCALYVDRFPQERDVDSGVPLFEGLLGTIVSAVFAQHRGRMQHMSRPPRSLRVFEMARAMVRDHNRLCASTPPFIMRHPPSIASGGLADRRLTAFVREWERGHPEVPVSEPDLLRRVVDARAGGTAEAETIVSSFLRREREDLQRWEGMITDSRDGVAAFVKRTYRAPLVEGRRLETIARIYVRSRMLSGDATDLMEITREVVAPDFAPFTEMIEQMAIVHANLIDLWLQAVKGNLEESLSDAHEALSLKEEELREIALRKEEVVALPDDGRALLEEAAVLADTSSEALLEVQRRVFLVGAILGESPMRADLRTRAGRIFEEHIGSARKSQGKQVEREQETFDDISRRVREMVVQAHLLNWRSARMVADADMKLQGDDATLVRVQRLVRDFSDQALQSSTVTDQVNATVARLVSAGVAVDSKLINSIRADLDMVLDMVDEMAAVVEVARSDHKKRKNTFLRERTRLAGENAARFLIAQAGAWNDALNALQRRAGEHLAKRIDAHATASEQTVARFSDSPTMDVSSEMQAFETEATAIRQEIAAIEAAKQELHREGHIHALLDDEGAVVLLPRPEIERRVRALMGDHALSAEQRQEIEAAISLLRQSTAVIEALDGRLKEEGDRLNRVERGRREGLEQVEAVLPFGAAKGLPPPGALEKKTADSLFRVRVSNNRRYDLQAQNILNRLVSARVLAVGGSSRLLDMKDAGMVRTWKKEGRKKRCKLQDVFGNAFHLSPGEFGVRLGTYDDLPDGHGFRRLRSALTILTDESTNGAELLLRLERKASKCKGRARDLRNGLFALLAQESDRNPSERLARWADANRAALVSLIGMAAKGWFPMQKVKPSKPTDILVQKRNEIAGMLRYPGFCMIQNKGGGKLFTDHARAQKALDDYAGGSFEIPILDEREKSGWRRADLGVAFQEELRSSKIWVDPPLVRDIERLATLRMRWMLVSDPRYAELGRISFGQGDNHIRSFLENLLLPLGFVLPDRPLVNRLLQDPIQLTRLACSLVENDSILLSIERSRLSPERILQSLDQSSDAEMPRVRPEKRSQLIDALHEDENYRRNISALVFLSRLVSPSVVTAYEPQIQKNANDVGRSAREAVKRWVLAVNQGVNAQQVLSGLMKNVQMEAAYQTWRHILIDTGVIADLLPEYARPEMSVEYAEFDPLLAEKFPELKQVSMAAIIEKASLFEGRDGAKPWTPVIGRLFDRYPHLRDLLTVIAHLDHKGMSGAFRKDWAAIDRLVRMEQSVSDVDQGGDVVKHTTQQIEERLRTCDGLLPLYAVHRDEILEELFRKRASGFTGWRELTGFDRPWLEGEKLWQNFTPMERLAFRAPEYVVNTPEQARQFIDVFGEMEVQQFAGMTDGEWVASFVSDVLIIGDIYPELNPAMALLFSACTDSLKAAECIAVMKRFFSGRIDPKAPDFLDRFVEFVTEPELLGLVREALSGPSLDEDSDRTLAMEVTHSDAPWLPSVEGETFKAPYKAKKGSGGNENGGGAAPSAAGGGTPPAPTTPGGTSFSSAAAFAAHEAQALVVESGMEMIETGGLEGLIDPFDPTMMGAETFVESMPTMMMPIVSMAGVL